MLDAFHSHVTLQAQVFEGPRPLMLPPGLTSTILVQVLFQRSKRENWTKTLFWVFRRWFWVLTGLWRVPACPTCLVSVLLALLLHPPRSGLSLGDLQDLPSSLQTCSQAWAWWCEQTWLQSGPRQMLSSWRALLSP